MATKKTSRSKASRSSRTSSGSRSRRDRKGVNVLLRDVDPEIIDVLKARAQRNGRSLQQELRMSLQRDAKRDFSAALAIAEAWQAKLAGRKLPSTLELLREDRDR